MKLKDIMKLRGETMRSLAEKMDTKHPNVVEWCNGKKNPSGTTLVKLAYHLECLVIVAGDGNISFIDPMKIHIES